MWQVTFAFLFQAITDLVERVASGGYTGVLDTAWCGLYQSPTHPIGPTSTFLNITEANYDGYVRQPVVWFPVIQSSGGPEVVYAQDLFFMPTDALVANLITGAFLCSSQYGGSLWMAAALAAPGVQLSGPQNGIKVQPVFQLPTQLVYGSPIVQS